MNSVREIAKSIIKEMESIKKECDPAAAKFYERMAVVSYADFLKRSPERSKEMNQQCSEEAALYCEKAISYGASETKIEQSFERLRTYWLPKLKGE